MKKVIYRLFMDYEKEEAWLNEMSAKGLHLVKYQFARYTFEVGQPGEYQYKIQLLEQLPSHPDSQNYLQFLEEIGVQQVDSTMRWVYLRAKTSDQINLIHPDVKCRLVQQKMIFKLFCTLLFVEFCCLIPNIINLIRHQMTPTIFFISILLLIIIVIIRLTLRSFRKIKKLEQEAMIFE